MAILCLFDSDCLRMSHDTQFWSMSQKGKMHKGAMLFEKEFLFMKMQEKKENYYFLPLDSLVKI